MTFIDIVLVIFLFVFLSFIPLLFDMFIYFLGPNESTKMDKVKLPVLPNPTLKIKSQVNKQSITKAKSENKYQANYTKALAKDNPMTLSKIMEFNISGVTYNNRQTNISKVRVNENLKLVLQRDNKFDPNAVLILNSLNLEMGYVPKEINLKVGTMLSKGQIKNIYVKNISGGNGYFFGVTVAIEYID
jgi:hypothetical protein